MRILLLAILLSSCASPARREYRDGPMVRAAPAFATPGYTPAGAGLPEYGAPADALPLPRSPHARVLPETPETMREPGLWAGDQPHASDGEFPDILGLMLPLPPVSEDIIREAATLRICANSAREAILASGAIPRIAKLTKAETRCLAAHLHLYCMENTLSTIAAMYPKHARVVANVRDAAVRLLVEQCVNGSDTRRVADLQADIIESWAPLKEQH